MPSERFYKLEEAKQQRIIDASVDEFLRAGYNEASINQIIKEADISRGSFYTYFADKSELFGLIFNKMKKRAADLIVQAVIRNDGDIFHAAKELMEEGLKMDPKHKDAMTALFHKLVSSSNIMEHVGNMCLNPDARDEVLEDMVDRIYENMNDLKDHISREDFSSVADMMVTTGIKALVTAKGEKDGYAMKTLLKQYRIMETGIRGGAFND